MLTHGWTSQEAWWFFDIKWHTNFTMSNLFLTRSGKWVIELSVGRWIRNEPNRLARNSPLARCTSYVQPVLVLRFRPELYVFLNYCPTKATQSAGVYTYAYRLMTEDGGVGGAGGGFQKLSVVTEGRKERFAFTLKFNSQFSYLPATLPVNNEHFLTMFSN